jgi:hypothetical protein
MVGSAVAPSERRSTGQYGCTAKLTGSPLGTVGTLTLRHRRQRFHRGRLVQDTQPRVRVHGQVDRRVASQGLSHLRRDIRAAAALASSKRGASSSDVIRRSPRIQNFRTATTRSLLVTYAVDTCDCPLSGENPCFRLGSYERLMIRLVTGEPRR